MFGHVFQSYWLALLLSPWNAPSMYDGCIEDMFYNSMTAYYLACGNVALLEEKFGAKWELHFIPLRTFVNSMTLPGQFAGRCLTHPEGIPFMPDKTRERVSEHMFARSKEGIRGMARLKDLINGLLGSLNGNRFATLPPSHSIQRPHYPLLAHPIPVQTYAGRHLNPVQAPSKLFNFIPTPSNPPGATQT
jgi:hypothetical protein